MIPIPEVTALDMAFGVAAMKILPPMKSIPDEFKVVSSSHCGGKSHYTARNGATANTKWLDVVSDWFLFGLTNARWTPKPGVDTGKALAAVRCCIGSFEPSHEHKKAGCAFLLSEWFEDVTYTKAK